MDDINSIVTDICTKAKSAWPAISVLSTESKNEVLYKMASLLEEEQDIIKQENQKDLSAGEKVGLSSAMLDRLTLNSKRINSMIKGLKEVAELSDPIGSSYDSRTRPNGLEISKMRVPIGVILMIYESRPNVTVDSAALCLKSGNCIILRGGKEAINSNRILAALFQRALRECELPEQAIQLVETTDRAAIDELLKQSGSIDLVIPRGGEGLIRAVAEKSKIPVIKHYKGVCHVYIDKQADLKKAREIAINAKVHRPGVCNAMETLLINRNMPELFISELLDAFHNLNVEIRGCPEICKIDNKAKLATEEDWYAEYLDMILAVKKVESMDQAIEHIAKYGSFHTEAIITENKDKAEEFIRRVDSSSVMVNASTRFSDGGEYGLGAEIGISTDKLHARGPMALEELTTYKWVVRGNGQTRN